MGLGAAALSGCSTTPQKSLGGGGNTAGSSDSLVWSNWPLSVDTADDGSIPSLAEFEKRTGIKADYLTDINSNDEWFAKVRPLMQSGQGLSSSLISPTDWLAGRFIELGWAEQLDRGKLPNAGNLLDAFARPPFDSGRTHSLAWQGWLAGIAVNTDVTGRDIHSVDELLTAPDLKGKVALLSELRETTGLLLLAAGHDCSDFTDQQFEEVLEQIRRALADKQLRRFTGNDYAPDLAKGNIAACFAWAGDVVQLHKDNPAVKFFVPESGAVLMEDVLMIPKHAPNVDGAHQLIDFYYEPEIAAQVASYVNAVCPVEGAQEAMTKVEPELADEPLIFPTDEMRAQMHGYKVLDTDLNQRYQEAFDKAIGL
jgi:spermidine/putrescine transport system substrate-binding protein